MKQMLDHGAIAQRAKTLLEQIEGLEELYERLRRASRAYNGGWSPFTGQVLVDHWNHETDDRPLFVEAMRVLALKTAVMEATGDPVLAELLTPNPVDSALHAVLAQHAVIQELEERIGFAFVHMTDNEKMATYDPDCLTHELYLAAFGEEPPARYWLDSVETVRRLTILKERYDSIGMFDFGLRHEIDFERSTVATGASA